MEIFKLFGSILIDNDKANNSISKTKGEADSLHGKLGAGIKTAGLWGAAILGAAAAVGGAIMGVAMKAANMADEIDEGSQKLGVTKQTYQELGYIFKQNGMSIDTFKGGMKKLTNTIGQAVAGNKSAQDSFASLGVAIKDSTGATRSQEDVMWDTMNALSGMTNQTDKAAMANKLFGKQGSELMPILNGGAKSIEEMREQANKLGIVLSDDSVNAGAKFADTMQTLKDTGNTAFAQIGLMFMPALQGLADWVILHMPEIQEFIKTAMKVVGDVIKDMKPIIDVLIDVFKIGFGIVVNVFKAFSALFKGDWSGLWDAVKGIIEGFFNIFKTIGKALFGKLFDGIKEKWNDLKDWVSEKVEWIQKQWNKVTGNVASVKNTYGFQHASGLNYVPYDGYSAMLHRGERIVPAGENNQSDLNGEILSVLQAILNKTGQSIVLDTGVLVGATAPSMDIALGTLARRR